MNNRPGLWFRALGSIVLFVFPAFAWANTCAGTRSAQLVTLRRSPLVAQISIPSIPNFDDFFRNWMRSSSSTSSTSSKSSSSSSKTSSSSSSSSSSTSSTSSSSVSSSPSLSLSDFQKRVIALVNEERKKNGLPALTEESHLTKAAQDHAEDMKNRNYFDHNTPEGKTPTQQIRDAGYPLIGSWSTGQNIAKGQKTPEIVMNAWMNSSGHRANILSKNFRDIGIGFYQNYWVQNFARHN